VTLTKERIEQLAPDQSSLSAALKLMRPATWPLLARDAEGGLLWGECQGSGATPYRVVTSVDDLGYKCTCPSRKFPCKHTLALMWQFCEAPQRFETAAPAPWVEEWLSRRRPKGSARNEGTASGASIAAAMAESAEVAADDPAAAARAAAQRQRLREQREAAVLAGLDELDRWILDQLQAGLAGFAQRAAQSARTIVTRLVDAKAQPLANRIEALTADIHRLPEQMRSDVVLERFAALVLISAAYRNQERLPAPLKADVRRAASWTTTREELLADPEAPRQSGTWIVAATRSAVQPDRLRRLETWLLAADPAAPLPVALIVDFVPASGGPSAPPFVPGETLAAELVFYPSAKPLRALLATRHTAGEGAWPDLPAGLGAALTRYRTALAHQPWLELWPLGAADIRLERLGETQLVLSDQQGLTLPVERGQTEALMPMLGLEKLSALFIWDGRFATMLAANTPIGRWYQV
jgi:SWIM zinc finger